MMAGADATPEWPLHNAMITAGGGAPGASLNTGGGGGIGYPPPAGLVIVAAATPAAARRLERVLTTDPGMGVVRHADAGYGEAVAFAQRTGVRIPMRPKRRP
jgi:urocanate hydratase